MIELLVVLLILGGLFVLLPTALVQTRPAAELRANARAVASILREGRSVAIHQNREAAVVIDTESRAVGLRGTARSTRIAPDVEVTLVTARSEQLDDRSGMIRFYPDGSSTGGSVKLLAADRSYRIAVDWLSGRVTIED